MTLKITLTHETQALHNLKSEWQALQERSSADGVYLTWEWVTAWWQQFKSDGELWLLQARNDDGYLVGLAAMMLVTERPKLGPIRGLAWRQLQFIGASMPCEHLDFIVEAGLEAQVVPAFLSKLSEEGSRWDVLYLSGICETSPSLNLLETVGIPWEEGEPLVAPYIPLPEEWEDYFKTLGQRRRTTQRSRLRQLNEKYPDSWSFEVVQHDADLKPTLDKLVALHQATWEERNEEGAFGDPRRRAFYYDLAQQFLNAGWMRVYRILLDGEVVASFYNYAYRGRVYYLASGIDWNYRDMNVGHVLTQLAIKTSIEDGMQEYDFLWGDEPYKYEWRGVNRYHHTRIWYASWLSRTQHQAFESARKMRETLRQRMKREQSTET